MNPIRRNLFRAGVAAVTAAAEGFSTSRAVAQQNAQGQNAQGQQGQNAASGCFRRGTNILTPKAERPIEHLRRGDLLQTISGLACIEEMVSYRADEPLVMLRAGALAPQQPDRDLTLTEHHAVLLDGMLIAVGLLINGTSILRVGGNTLPEFFNIRLPAGHGVIYAHNTPVETSYDMGTESPCLTRYGYRSRYREMQGYLRSAWAPIYDRRNSVDRIRDRIDARWSRRSDALHYLRRREQNDTLKVIGKFDKDGDGYSGWIFSPNQCDAITFRPIQHKQEDGADFLVTSEDKDGNQFDEIGAAWERTTSKGAHYLLVKLNLPTFWGEAHCALIEERDGPFGLVWERTKLKVEETAESAAARGRWISS